MRRRRWLGLWVSVLVASVALGCSAPRGAPAAQEQGASAAPVTLKAVTAWTRDWPFNQMYFEWVKRVNERSAGRIKIDYVGGPEVYPSLEQLEPLKRGVINTIITSTAYVAGALPEVNATWLGFGATPTQLRDAGLADALDKITREKAGVTVLGFPLQTNFNVYLKRPISSADLSGLKLRSTPVYDPVLKGLGAATVSVPPAEIQSALQSGVVDGFAWPAPFVVEPGYAQYISYKVVPSWWVGTDIALMDARTFDGLPADLRQLLIDLMKEIEAETPAYFLAKEREQDEVLRGAGVQLIELPAAEVEKVKRLHWEGGSKAFLLDPSPQHGPALRDLMSRFAPK